MFVQRPYGDAGPMRRPAFLIAAFAALAFALAPAIADARPGGGASSGSRGSRTYSAPPPTQTAPNAARPMDRTMTQPSRPDYAQPGAAAQARPQGSFMRGLLGGLVGAGLIGLLFGAGLFHGGFGGVLGALLQIALIGGLVWLAFRLFRSRAPRPAMAGGPTGYAREAQQPMGGGVGRGGPASQPVTLQPSDFEAFERLLKDINVAWSRQDLTALRSMATPEMTGYFAQDLQDLNARGWRNETADVRLEQGDLSEAWNEDGQDYATVAMRFSLVDVTRRVADGAVVEGDPARRQMTTEIWTFVRSAPGGRWQLSAIQQTR